MRFHFLRASLMAALLLLAACSPQPTLEVPAEFQGGQKLFHKICSNCHGADALGIQGKAPKLVDVDYIQDNFSDDDIRTTVIEGTDKMPPQKAKVSDDEIAKIIKYLRYSQQTADLVAEAEDEDDTE
jgi:mono/diheme cytochrome c family protein